MREAAAPPASPDALPRSDVSAGVGLAGLIGLFVWIALCRNFPEISAALDLPGPRERLSGPYAALAGLLFSGVPMVLWSIFVDRVHRRESTGIDWDNPREPDETMQDSLTKLAGLWATWAIIAALYFYGRWYWDGNYLFAMEVLGAAAVPALILSVPYVIWFDRRLVEPRDSTWHFGALVTGRGEWDREAVAGHWRSWIIKGFFGAFMISILPGGFAAVVQADLASFASQPGRLAVAMIELLFVIDVQIGTVGYLLTLRPLDAHIRSGNPLLGGWLSALLCYPPFVYGILGASGIMAYEVNAPGWQHWLADQPLLLSLWGGWLVVLTGVYAWATVVFGIRFSNLTYRGVITHGPYRFTRHPAYLSKNLFWWSATLPFFVTSGDPWEAVRNCIGLTLVSALYYWRARTEEAHLLAEDAKYREYHAWMARYGTITAPLEWIRRALLPRPRSAPLQPAE